MNDKLNRYAKNITSQYGEDGILEYIIKNANGKILKIACEFGAWDGENLSNIYTLWHDNGWMGILIEMDKGKFERLESLYSDLINIIPLNCYVTPNGKDSLDEIFKKHKIPYNIGILSIDIDSTDYHIWSKLKKVNPQIVVIEYNNNIPPFIEYHDPEEELFLRTSLKALETLGKKKGYVLICSTVTNAIFIKKEMFNIKRFPDMPAEYLYDYEGQLKNNTLAPMIIGSQFISSYPVFTSKPPFIIKTYYRIRKIYASLFRGGPGYKKPTQKTQKELEKSHIYFK